MSIHTPQQAQQIKDLLLSNKGKWFTVTFVKKDGTERTLTCHQGHFKGHDGVNPVAHIPKYLTVVTTDGEWKNVNCEAVLEIAMRGKVYKFGDK